MQIYSLLVVVRTGVVVNQIIHGIFYVYTMIIDTVREVVVDNGVEVGIHKIQTAVIVQPAGVVHYCILSGYVRLDSLKQIAHACVVSYIVVPR